jgi:hypothetical protein
MTFRENLLLLGVSVVAAAAATALIRLLMAIGGL